VGEGMTRPRIYVAGPYSSSNELGILLNIKRGIDICAELIEMGFAPYCPWLDCLLVISHGVPGNVLFDISVEWMPSAHCLYASPGWEQSKGAMKELSIADDLHIPVFYNFEACEAFVKNWKEEHE
jgi:hypothetical protein